MVNRLFLYSLRCLTYDGNSRDEHGTTGWRSIRDGGSSSRKPTNRMEIVSNVPVVDVLM